MQLWWAHWQSRSWCCWQHRAAARRARRVLPDQRRHPDASKRSKPDSFAPRPRPEHNAYGAPIGDTILTKRVKKKPNGTAPAPLSAS